MKKYFVIGNPIEHSLSPLIHNYWFKKYKLNDNIYEKKKIEKKDLKDIINQVKNGEVKGVNVTVPFKKEIINFLDHLEGDAKPTQSVNTLHKIDNQVHGYNTDTEGFKKSLQENFIDYENKNIFILGAGGVTSSIIEALAGSVNKIYISNRTKEKAKELKKSRDSLTTLTGGEKNKIEVIDWKEKPEGCDIVINTTSVGITKSDNLDLDFRDYENKKNVLFYDLIYNPKETNFLKDARLRGNKIMNGKMMFIWQAQIAFRIWTGISPKIDDNIIKLIDND